MALTSLSGYVSPPLHSVGSNTSKSTWQTYVSRPEALKNTLDTMRDWYNSPNNDPAKVVSEMRRLDNGSINDKFKEGRQSYVRYDNKLTLHDIVVFDGCHEAKIGRISTAVKNKGPLLHVSLQGKEDEVLTLAGFHGCG